MRSQLLDVTVGVVLLHAMNDGEKKVCDVCPITVQKLPDHELEGHAAPNFPSKLASTASSHHDPVNHGFES